MTYNQQLKKGRKIEKEHQRTYDLVKRNPKIFKDKFYESIAKDHLKEDPEYYTKLAKAKL